MMRYDSLNFEVKQNPYPYYEVLRREEPVCWLDSMQAFAVADPSPFSDRRSQRQLWS